MQVRKRELLVSSPPLTKYFKVIPKSIIKENVVPMSTTPNIPLTRGPLRRNKIGSRGSPLECISVSSDDDDFSPSRKKSFTIKKLFDDNIKNKPSFPSVHVNSSQLPYYLYGTTPSTSSSDSSDQELPVFPISSSSSITKSKKIPSTKECKTPSTSLTPINKVLSKFSLDCKQEFSPQSDSVGNGNEANMCDDTKTELTEPMEDTDVLGDHLEFLMQTETKQQALDVMINCRGLATSNNNKGTTKPPTRAFTTLQDGIVDHHLTLCMASPSLQLLSAVDYIRMIMSPFNMPSGNTLYKIWKALLENEIDRNVAEHTVQFFSSLLLVYHPNNGCQLKEYTIFIEQIQNDINDLLSSNVQWKVILLEFVSGLLLLEYRSSLLQDGQSHDRLPLFLRVFWPLTRLYHVNKTIRCFIMTTVNILESEASVLLTRRLDVCCQFLFLINSFCDVSHDLCLQLQQQQQSLNQQDLFLSLLHPFSLKFSVYKSISNNTFQ